MKTPVVWPLGSKREALAEVMAMRARRGGDIVGLVYVKCGVCLISKRRRKEVGFIL